MTIALDRPTTSDHTTPARNLYRVGGTAPRPQATEEGVTVTVSVTLPAGTGDVEAALIADDLRTHAQRLTATRDGRTTVGVSNPNTFAATGSSRSSARTLPPRGQGSVAVSPLRPRRPGVVSPNSPARKDAETARRRALRATAVSPASPSVAVEDSLVIDLFGRRVRIDGHDVDLTYKEFELLAELSRNARRTISREELMESVWAEAPSDTGERTVDVHVRRVRTKLGRYRRLISTVRGAGYRLDPGSDVAILSS
ncbi:winged helix-turn-helix domain-containing protein [Brachybacterium sacelli]|uniref:DNA-binding winged helix-turn-helix (WHTH) protein n=1 Tax=Brachybacterium sacelli TaxID=173364 RepID=A0ABS4WY49_9MICO|nr:winged helix-turn-helix domain-containing protein [Brachybacterium sacelli]MBP2381126.1 DNA-binding winged helix-turn-helix (wHTH) protein [Brachybacterium sacelli]